MTKTEVLNKLIKDLELTPTDLISVLGYDGIGVRFSSSGVKVLWSTQSFDIRVFVLKELRFRLEVAGLEPSWLKRPCPQLSGDIPLDVIKRSKPSSLAGLETIADLLKDLGPYKGR